MTLPGFHECPECGGTGHYWAMNECLGAGCNASQYGNQADQPCPTPECPECGGAGQVPDDDTVEAVQDILWHLMEARTGPKLTKYGRAALLAYARHTQEKA